MNSTRYVFFKFACPWHITCKPIQKIYFVYKGYKRQPRETMASNKTAEKGLQDGWTRATFILRRDYLKRLKASAYWERKKIKEVIDEALGLYLRGKRRRGKHSLDR